MSTSLNKTYNMLENDEITLASNKVKQLRRLIPVLVKLNLCRYPYEFKWMMHVYQNRLMREILNNRIMKP